MMRRTTDEQIQISKDSELMVQVISLIASYSIENDMSPNETIKIVAENMLGLLKFANFDNWEKKTLPSVISTSDDCVSRKQAKIDVIPDSLYTSEQVIALLDNLSPVTPTHCIATVRFSEDDLREICNERIEIECTHGMCKDCTKSKVLNDFEGYSIVCSRFGRMAVNPDFYCADFEKGGSENGSN